jgi:peptidoglycan/LPS O-acetylase OafA/YrhL
MKKAIRRERGPIGRTAAGLAAAYAVIFALLLAASALTAKGNLAESAMKPAAAAACFAGGLAGALAAVRGATGKRFSTALRAGGVVLATMLLAGLAMSGKHGFSAAFLGNAGAAAAGFLLVGLAAGKRTRKRR